MKSHTEYLRSMLMLNVYEFIPLSICCLLACYEWTDYPKSEGKGVLIINQSTM